MKPTTDEALNAFAKQMHEQGFTIIVPKDASTYFSAFKDGVFIYIQKERWNGYSFSTINKPSKENGTGARALTEVDLTLENLTSAINFFNRYNGYRKKYPIVRYASLKDYFSIATNNILENYIYKFDDHV